MDTNLIPAGSGENLNLFMLCMRPSTVEPSAASIFDDRPKIL